MRIRFLLSCFVFSLWGQKEGEDCWNAIGIEQKGIIWIKIKQGLGNASVQ